ncbi:MAG: ATP-binding protein [Suipraeoptans sp.]
MKEIKKYLSKVFMIITFATIVVISVIDSIFDEIAGGIINGESIIFALVLYIGVHIIVFLVAAGLFTNLANRRIEKLNEKVIQDKNLLFANVAHDLKTPLTTVIGYSKALRDGVVTEPKQQQEMLDAIALKSEKANELLDSMFQYTKLSSTGFDLVIDKYNLARLLKETVADFYDDFQERKIILELDIPDEPVIVRMDQVEMRRALSNLIINAYKHNKQNARVLIQIQKDRDIRVIIADDGIRLSEKKEELFEPFISGSEARENADGSGLGLAVVKSIVDKHGFKVDIEEMNKPYTKAFIIEIPVVKNYSTT